VKILLVTHVLRRGDGQGRVNYEIAKYASENGHDVTIVASEVSADLLELPNIQWIQLKSGKVPTRLLKYQIFALRSMRWLQQHRDEYDIINVNGGITYAASDVNSVHFVHSGWTRSTHYTVKAGLSGVYHRLYSAVNCVFEQAAFKNTRRIIAVSEQVADEIRELNIPHERINVITNGVATDEFYPAEESRTELQLPDAVFLALFAGDLKSQRKNLDTVLRALVDAPGVHLAVAGKTEGSAYPALAQSLGIADRVHFLGFRKDIPAVMRACDVFVFPSRYEACSLALLEALASGLPIITAKTVGGWELMDEPCGFVMEDPDDAAVLAQYLNLFVRAPEQSLRWREAARRVALKNTWSAMAKKYIDSFEYVMSEKKRTAAV
jgi:glycosyltransferase involved in cell wall biosynthesis